ncbi:MAG: hypothetical protein R2746_04550 [Acidimicrobiales bacterium]
METAAKRSIALGIDHEVYRFRTADGAQVHLHDRVTAVVDGSSQTIGPPGPERRRDRAGARRAAGQPVRRPGGAHRPGAAVLHRGPTGRRGAGHAPPHRQRRRRGAARAAQPRREVSSPWRRRSRLAGSGWPPAW